MEINKIYTKIKELGHVHSKRDELNEYCLQNVQQILNNLSRRILSSDGADVLDCIFNGFSEGESVTRHKVKIIDIVLKVMRKETTSITHCGDVVSRLCLELPRMPVDDLVQWCNYSVQSIIEDSDVNMIWRDVLPECMSVVSCQDKVKHCDTEMSSDDFKQQCVHTLCQCQWKEKQYVQLAAMFKDLQLSREAHKQVVNNFCSYIIDIPPDTLPPLVHQLLKLCKLHDLDIVLGHLSHYFSIRLYAKLEPPPQDSESTTMDIDDIVPHSPAELSRCLSTCIYHISQGAAEPELVRKHLKSWPKTQLLKAPFIMDLALALSDKGADFRSVCLDVIKAAIEQRELDELRSKESAWVRSVLPPDVDVVSVLKVLTTESANHRQLTVIGLINLAFSLLSVARTKPVAAACWSHGKLILVRLSKSQPETAAHILSQLADRLAGYCSQRQYADCLYVLCKLTPVSLERCTQLGTILENCQPSPTDYMAAAAVLDAVHPLLNFSTRTRDTLVMVCRKGLHSRDCVQRCLSVCGFLSVLRHVRVPRGAGASQAHCSEAYSATSYLTQLTVDLHATQQGTQVTSRVRNEAMCMEVVSILRRCLVQDAQVKELLYTRIYECAKEKSGLHEPILELLYEHLYKYVPEDGAGTPLLIDKCVQINAITAVLTEPISRLLYVAAQFLQPVEEEDLEDILSSDSAESGAHLKNKLKAILEQLCSSETFGQVDLENISLTDLTPESKAKSLVVQQTLQCYETLIAYRIMQWNASSSDIAQLVYKLYKDYDQLLQKTKVPPKSVKKRRKSLNETGEVPKSQKSQKSQKPAGKSPTKLTNMVKDRAGPFKTLPCVWDLKFCIRVMELLYSEEVLWSSMEERNLLRGRKDFHHWALKCVSSVLSNEHIEKRAVATHVVELARILYHRCVCRFQNMYDFDDQTTVSCIEVFRICLNLLFSPTYSLKMEFFLTKITSLPDSSAAECVATILEQIHAALVETDSSVDGSNAGSDRATPVLLNTAALLLTARVDCTPALTAVIVKLEEYVRTTSQDCLSLIPPLLTAGCRDQQESQLMDDLLTKLTTALGLIDEEETSTTEETDTFPTIDSKSGHTVLNHICVHLGDRFKYVEHLLNRAKDLTVACATTATTTRNRIDRELKEVYKWVVVQLCQAGGWCARAAALRCAVGAGSERVLGACVRLYALLATLTKHIDVDTAVLVRFERLLKLSGKKLSSVTDNLITYLEASQQQQKASRVLRDTKLIPRLVLEAEQYTRNVILLANKGKLNWQQYMSLGTARDFRIKAPVLQEVLNARGTRDDPDETRDEENQGEINDASTLMTPILTLHVDENGGEGPASRSKKRRIQ